MMFITPIPPISSPTLDIATINANTPPVMAGKLIQNLFRRGDAKIIWSAKHHLSTPSEEITYLFYCRLHLIRSRLSYDEVVVNIRVEFSHCQVGHVNSLVFIVRIFGTNQKHVPLSQHADHTIQPAVDRT